MSMQSDRGSHGAGPPRLIANSKPFEWNCARAELNALIARMHIRHAETRQLKLVA
jgi:hypothetical protein